MPVFYDRARAWFKKFDAKIVQCAQNTSEFLLNNSDKYSFRGEHLKKPIVPNFHRNLEINGQPSRFLNGENISNSRLRGWYCGIWEILSETANAHITPSTEGLHGIILTDASLQLFRDLEFKRLRATTDQHQVNLERDMLEHIRARYYPSPGDGSQLNRFNKEKIVPMVEMGLIDALKMGKGYDIVSGPVLIAFTDIAYVRFLEKHSL